MTLEQSSRPGRGHTEEIGTIFYRAPGYPDRCYTVILIGADKSSMTYIGTVDQNWRTI